MNSTILLHLVAAGAGAAAALAPAPSAAADARPRLLVLTDIGGDPDDQQAMIRLMTYSNEFDIEGLVATASGTPGELKKKVVRPDLIREIVDAYGAVRGSLAANAEGYPTAEHLRERIKAGNPQRGLDAIGEGCDTEGSRWIIGMADRPEARPVNITIWGGQTDLAQALWRVRTDRGVAGLQRFIRRIRVYDIADQDGIVDWIWKEFPGLFYVLGRARKGIDKRESVYRGMYLGGDESLTSRDWIDTNVRRAHGPLGALYPTRTWTAPNPHSALKEGDTPSWFYFLPRGLNDPEHPEWGGWGGRFARTRDRVYRDAPDTVGSTTNVRASVWRWRDAFQRDFQARMDWCVRPPSQANHSPIAVCNGDATLNVLRASVNAGGRSEWNAAGTHDPDGDALVCRWWIYAEPSRRADGVKIADSHTARTRLSIPPNASGGEIHLILEVTDDGEPPLTSYRRVVIAVD